MGRSPLRSRHITRIAAALLLLMGAGAWTHGYIQRRNMSPFVFWEFRPGMSFKALDQSAFRQTKRRFTCFDVAGSARLCEMRVTGIAGKVRVLVDARGRAAVVQFLPDSASVVMREEGRRIAAEWNLVRRGVADRRDPPDSTTSITRWQSENGKYAAMMRYHPPSTTPALVHLADVMSIETIAESTPLASLTLALDHLIESSSTQERRDVESALAATMFGRATDPANETDAPRTAAATLARCETETPDPVVPSTDGRAMFDEPTARLLELAIPAVYPGSRLALGDGAWIVDSVGRSERVTLGRGDFASGSGIVVFAIGFPGRIAVAVQRLEGGVPDRYCGAPAELLFARRNDDGSLGEAHLVPVDREASWSEISTIIRSEPALTGEPPYLRVRYEAVYVTDRSRGSIEWEAIVGDDPPRSTRRVPLTFTQQARDDDITEKGYVIITGRPAGGIELSTLEQHDWGFSTRTMLVPLDSSGVLPGARILDQLAGPSPRR